MPDKLFVRSIGPDTAAIGARAAGHLNIAFRGMLQVPEAVHHERYMSLVTGAMHPMGNLAVVAEADDPATTRSALEPLLAILCGDNRKPLQRQPSLQEAQQFKVIVDDQDFLAHLFSLSCTLRRRSPCPLYLDCTPRK